MKNLVSPPVEAYLGVGSGPDVTAAAVVESDFDWLFEISWPLSFCRRLFGETKLDTMFER